MDGLNPNILLLRASAVGQRATRGIVRPAAKQTFADRLWSISLLCSSPRMRRIRQSVRRDEKRDAKQHCAEHNRECSDSDQHAGRGGRRKQAVAAFGLTSDAGMQLTSMAKIAMAMPRSTLLSRLFHPMKSSRVEDKRFDIAPDCQRCHSTLLSSKGRHRDEGRSIARAGGSYRSSVEVLKDIEERR